MLSFLPFLVSTALASGPTPLRVSANVRGTSANWTVPDLQPGELLSEQVRLSKRRHAELSMTCSMTETGDAELGFAVYVVRDPLFGGAKRELIGTPTITLPQGEPANILAGVNVPFTDKGFDHPRGQGELVVRVAPVPHPARAE